MTGEHCTHRFNGAGDHRRNLIIQLAPEAVDREQPGLYVPRILAGFEKQDVDAAIDEAFRLVVVIGDQFRKRYAASHRDGFGGRAH